LGAFAAFLAAAVMLTAVIVLFVPVPGGLAMFACYVVVPALVLVVLAATKSLFNTRGYGAADRIIVAAIALDALGIVYALAAGSYVTLDSVRGASGLVGLAIYALLFALLIPLGLHLLRFRALAGGLWAAPAILYFVLSAVMLAVWAAVVLGTRGLLLPSTWRGGGDMVALGVLMLSAAVLVPAAMIAHGLALLGAARRRA
jgi:hypothetical protein